jgi:hypothetical protein
MLIARFAICSLAVEARECFVRIAQFLAMNAISKEVWGVFCAMTLHHFLIGDISLASRHLQFNPAFVRVATSIFPTTVHDISIRP